MVRLFRNPPSLSHVIYFIIFFSSLQFSFSVFLVIVLTLPNDVDEIDFGSRREVAKQMLSGQSSFFFYLATCGGEYYFTGTLQPRCFSTRNRIRLVCNLNKVNSPFACLRLLLITFFKKLDKKLLRRNKILK